MSQYTKTPNGEGRILGWTVEFNPKPNQPRRGVIIGELVQCTTDACHVGQRFIAMTDDFEDDGVTTQWLLEEVSLSIFQRQKSICFCAPRLQNTLY